MSSSVLPAPTGPATLAQSFAEVLAEVVGAAPDDQESGHRAGSGK